MKKFKDEKHYRLKNYNYAQNGYYYVTICTKDREHLFGEICEADIQLSPIGNIAKQYWEEIPRHFTYALLDEYIFMPNHMHGIIRIEYDNNEYCRNAINRVPTGCGGITEQYNSMGKQTLGEIIRWFKGRSTYEIHKLFPTIEIWQPRFYDHIVRNEHDLERIRKYIILNPKRWEENY